MTPQPAVRDILIRSFQPSDAAAFRELNEHWIEKWFGLEDVDRKLLNDPENNVLRTGGHIFIAVSDGRPVGCCALLAEKPGVYELGKMAVAEEYRGRGIGRQILEYVIEQARVLGARSLVLASNSILANAIHLYESLGFRHLPPERIPPSPYARTNVFMEIEL